MADSPRLVTFGVLSFNRCRELRETLLHLLADGYPAFEIIVLDNGSTDGSAEMLAAEFGSLRQPPVKVVRRERNAGVAARNELFDLAAGEYFFSFDDDSRPADRTMVGSAVEILERDPSIAALCCACVHPETGYDETRGIERFASGGNAERGYDLLNVAEGGTIFRMADVRRTAGYDARLFFSREGNDLGFQLLRLGKRIVYRPDLVVHHMMSPTGRQAGARLTLFTRNTYWILWKYFPVAVALFVGLLFGLRRLLPCLKDPRRFGPVLKGIVHGMTGFRTMRAGTTRFTFRESVALRHWFFKTLYE